MVTPAGPPTPPQWQSDLQIALQDFYVRPAQAANRMDPIQRVVQRELQQRLAVLGGLAAVQTERPIRGKHRVKNWDIAFTYAQRPQLAISTKSIMANVSGTVPNRIDDAMGECVNVHSHDPGMVLGYLFVMNAVLGSQATRDGRLWVDILAQSLLSFSGRRSEQDAGELFEAATLLIVDFAATPPTFTFHQTLLAWDQFFEVLIGQVRARNPMIDQALTRG